MISAVEDDFLYYINNPNSAMLGGFMRKFPATFTEREVFNKYFLLEYKPMLAA